MDFNERVEKVRLLSREMDSLRMDIYSDVTIPEFISYENWMWLEKNMPVIPGTTKGKHGSLLAHHYKQHPTKAGYSLMTEQERTVANLQSQIEVLTTKVAQLSPRTTHS